MRSMTLQAFLSLLLVVLLVAPPGLLAANHREAPITAIDRLADIADFFAFVSYDDPSKVTFILDVDPLLEPSNGPNYFPFDPEILYAIKVDNNHDGVEDVTFEFRFQTEIRQPDVFTGYVGAGTGIPAPANSPAPIAPGTPIVPPAITDLDGPNSAGLNLRQTYTVTLVRGAKRVDLTNGQRLIAVPANAGPRTMPNYDTELAPDGIYNLPGNIKVFAGTVDDPFWIDLGAAFDSINFRTTGFPAPGVLTDAQEANDTQNFAADDVSGFNVNAIAIEVPIAMITSDSQMHGPCDPRATIGTWGATSRPRVTIRRSPAPVAPKAKATTTSTVATWRNFTSILVESPEEIGDFRQVQRMGNALFNELIIGTGFKDRFSMSQPKDDAQFARFALDPLLARVFNAVYEALFGPNILPVPTPPRVDLLPLVQYQQHAQLVSAVGGLGCTSFPPGGPVADLLRLNTGVPPTPVGLQKRMGMLAGDLAGYPNGRRVNDDVTDISARAVAGVLAGPPFNGFPYNRIGDGVNANDRPYPGAFPYVAFAHDGRNSRHVDPGEAGCAGAICPIP
ncbi:MAG TPA: DUF4331 domain-containing protein [Candidatus Xenobia bacterium]|nr:DUF4331 domain-containing protein [Candidatus Xenobia bacterium]